MWETSRRPLASGRSRKGSGQKCPLPSYMMVALCMLCLMLPFCDPIRGGAIAIFSLLHCLSGVAILKMGAWKWELLATGAGFSNSTCPFLHLLEGTEVIAPGLLKCFLHVGIRTAFSLPGFYLSCLDRFQADPDPDWAVRWKLHSVHQEHRASQ